MSSWRRSEEGGILGAWYYTRQVGRRRSWRRVVQFQGIPRRTVAKAVLGSWCYTRRNGQRCSQADGDPNSREFPAVWRSAQIPQKAAEVILGSWCYTRRTGIAVIQADGVSIPGNSLYTAALFIWVGSLASGWCWVALWNPAFWLAQCSSGVTRAAERGAAFSLAARRAFLRLLLRHFLGRGKARGAPGGALVAMADAWVSLVCTGGVRDLVWELRDFTGVLRGCTKSLWICTGGSLDCTRGSL